jgi:predicted RNase H-like nuclease (RuvC/YqgF family)
LDAKTQSDLETVRGELVAEKNLNSELSKKLELAQESLAKQESISKIAQEREEEIQTLKSALASREHELQAAETNADILKKKIANLETSDSSSPAVKSVNISQIQFLR